MRTYSKLLGLTALALAALIIYLDWTGDRRSGPLLSDLRTLPINSQGQPGSAGNLLGIETRLMPADYQSRERLQLKFTTYLDQARDAGLLNPRTIVVLPEHVGTGLFALGEKPEVQQARTLRDAMQWMALSNPWDYVRALFANEGGHHRTEAVLKIKGQQMADDYQLIFGNLARDYGVTLVAGSIVLPEPRLEDGSLRIGDGPLRQVSLSFAADGQPIGPLQYKMALSRYERRYSQAPDLPSSTLPTPAGRLAVLIGCDGYIRQPPADAELLALPGMRDNPHASCATAPLPQTSLPRMEVRTFGLPWNLVGSPRRPAPQHYNAPVQLNNLWLPERS
ncbi:MULTISPECIES: carbon-nitrogen hydrolase [Pseudomonadaceae]|uniref:carbon-nitrogen hydrolase n=1 Tax=Pseudomonadaceae TaxID=135621 RepID=UPI0015E31856|nr:MULTISPECIES: carbon-nitrogen hydrolase [Pseudomonadaceae]MBA1278487.1 carbon-nitrogen hydrolase [Stutzerimonas stutzeri]MBC8648247.1 carbon-nitrogen hydrolase [Pseudomonas sp. MT4]QXY90202.1 carbon-nitrogen hydrolase [Pseudomonas sp. MTM4]